MLMLINEYNNLNTFLKNLKLKKKYINKLSNKSVKIEILKKERSKKILKNSFLKNCNSENVLVKYIIDIKFSKTNTLLNISDFSGKPIFFYSSGLVGFSGKLKKRPRFAVFKQFYNLLVSKLVFLRNHPIALHLTNVGIAKRWICKSLKKRFFIVTTQIFTSYPYNGCRKKKQKRKKQRKKKY
jgi:ribosomal protein S11